MAIETESRSRYLVAERRGKCFALPLTHVRGALPRPVLELVPLGEPDWMGVLVVRGEVVTAVRPDRWLDLAEEEIPSEAEPEALVIFSADIAPIALGFDRLRGVVALGSGGREPHPGAAERPWLTAIYADARFEALTVINGSALGRALLEERLPRAVES
jgi:chemotaxis signal transduction protein